MENMYAECRRLRSFDDWSAEGEDILRFHREMARAGFYACDELGKVKCYFCPIELNLTGEIIDVPQIHRKIGPTCPFFLHPECTDNVRIFDRDELTDEQLRLSTFVHWPVSFISRQALAKSGFYYTHYADEVQCTWCNGVIGRWEEGDDPFVEHEKFFPSCQKVIENAINSDPMPDPSIGIQLVQTPQRPLYSTLDSRIRTFADWPMGHIQDPVRLAQAGFYHLGHADEVRCFHCDGGLRFWLVDDDPWFEHARCFPKCQFLQLAKGQLFIENVQTQIKQSSSVGQSQQSQQAQQQQQQQQQPQQPHQQQHSPQQHAPHTHPEQTRSCPSIGAPTMSLEDALSTEPVRMALQMGLNEGRIRLVMMRMLNTSGRPFPTLNELVEGVLEDQMEQQNLEPTTSSRMGRHIANELITAITSLREVSQQAPSDQPETPRPITSSTDGAVSSFPKVNDKDVTKKDEPLGAASSSVAASHTVDTVDMSTEDEATARLKEENKRLKDARECKICMSEEVGIVFCPCGHLVSCVQCAPAVLKCPVCRAFIKGRVRTFLS